MRASLLAVALLFAACDTGGTLSSPSPLAETRWVLVEFEGRTAEVESTLGFESAGAFGGVAACNTYAGIYAALSGGVVGPRFSATVQSVTEAGCPGDLNAYEDVYLDALRSAMRWAVDGDRLMLTLADGAGEMVYARTE